MKPSLSRSKAILHPVRARILVTLHDRPLTPLQLAAHLEDVPLGTVYRHLNLLLDAGLVEVARERRVHGTVERQFALVEAASFLNDTDREQLTGEDILGLVSSLTGVVQAAFHRYVREAPLPPREGEVAFLVKSLYLTPEEYALFRQEVLALLAKAGRRPSPVYERRLIGFFAVPDPDPRNSAPPDET